MSTESFEVALWNNNEDLLLDVMSINFIREVEDKLEFVCQCLVTLYELNLIINDYDCSFGHLLDYSLVTLDYLSA